MKNAVKRFVKNFPLLDKGIRKGRTVFRNMVAPHAKETFERSVVRNITNGTQLNGHDSEEPCFHEVRNLAEFLEYEKKMKTIYAKRSQVEKLLAMGQGDFRLVGYDPMINRQVPFKVDYQFSTSAIDNVKVPNYRESLHSEATGSNSRIRATVLAMRHLTNNNRNLHVYLTEQVTRLYGYCRSHFSKVVGSEYLGSNIQKGTVINGIRHEDVTDLSFADDSFGLIVTLEVLEHVPNYKKAYAELFRCTRKGGIVLISVPFVTTNHDNLIRSTIDDKGEIKHILPEEYHGDPVNPKGGILCFQYFGWQMLDELRQAGFTDVKSVFIWSLYYGILGKDIMVISAQKS
jgi:Methyltransferase domain